MNDIFEILEEKYSPVEIIELLNNFDKDELKDYAISHDICLKCYSDLTIHTWKESREEYFGTPSYQIMSEFYCQNCGAVYE